MAFVTSRRSFPPRTIRCPDTCAESSWLSSKVSVNRDSKAFPVVKIGASGVAVTAATFGNQTSAPLLALPLCWLAHPPVNSANTIPRMRISAPPLVDAGATFVEFGIATSLFHLLDDHQ